MKPGREDAVWSGMTTPRKPADPPSEGAPLDNNPTGTTPNGIPDGMEGEEATGLPTSDRHEAEMSPNDK